MDCQSLEGFQPYLKKLLVCLSCKWLDRQEPVHLDCSTTMLSTPRPCPPSNKKLCPWPPLALAQIYRDLADLKGHQIHCSSTTPQTLRQVGPPTAWPTVFGSSSVWTGGGGERTVFSERFCHLVPTKWHPFLRAVLPKSSKFIVLGLTFALGPKERPPLQKGCRHKSHAGPSSPFVRKPRLHAEPKLVVPHTHTCT